MSDIFREIDEEVRREKLVQHWNRYGTLIVIAAFLFVAAIGGWRGYQYWDAKKAAENGARFEAALALENEGKHAEAEAAFAKIAAEGTSGYRILARLQEAGELSRRDAAGAVKLYDALAADSAVNPTLQDLARTRAALLLVDTATYDEIRTRMEPVSSGARPFRHTAREILAYAAWRAGDAAATRRWAEAVSTDPESPVGTRSRVEMLVALVASVAQN